MQFLSNSTAAAAAAAAANPYGQVGQQLHQIHQQQQPLPPPPATLHHRTTTPPSSATLYPPGAATAPVEIFGAADSALPSAREDIHTKQRAARFRKSCLGRCFRCSLWPVLWFCRTTVLVLEKCCPGRFAHTSVEEGAGATSRARKIAGRWNAEFVSNWCSIMIYLLLLSTCAILLVAFLVMAPRSDADAYARAMRSETLMRHCYSHEDRSRVLQEPAQQVPVVSISKGVLPCGTQVERLKARLVDLHRRHPDHDHNCLTAKHLNHSYAIVSMLQSDGKVAFLFNPENYAPLGSDRVPVTETSDFYPLHPPINVSRPLRAWISYTDSAAVKIRVTLEHATLHCVLSAWEILSGEHYIRFGPALEAVAEAQAEPPVAALAPPASSSSKPVK